MSFSESFRVRASDSQAAAEQAATIARKIRAIDEAAPIVRIGIVEGHQAQIAGTFEALGVLADRYPDAILVGTISGTANTDGSGSLSVAYHFERA